MKDYYWLECGKGNLDFFGEHFSKLIGEISFADGQRTLSLSERLLFSYELQMTVFNFGSGVSDPFVSI